jgi:ElaB/YqjD/DUF883 family membrane-anchored ribosome-binding protein
MEIIMTSADTLRTELADLGNDCLEMADDHACETAPEFDDVMRKLRLAIAEARPAIMQAKTAIVRKRRAIAAEEAAERRDDARYGTYAEQHRTHAGSI